MSFINLVNLLLVFWEKSKDKEGLEITSEQQKAVL